MDTTQYEAWLLGQRLGDLTVTEYVRTIKRVARIVDEQGWTLELTTGQTRWLADRTPRSTRKGLRSALAHYWRMVDFPGPLDAILTDTEAEVDVYKGLSESDAGRLEAYAHHHDELAVLVGLYLGLRRSEIARLRWDDFCGDWVQVNGKGRRKRTLPVHPDLAEHLNGNGGWVFPGRDGHAASSTIYGRINRTAEAAGIGRIKPHALRHTCLTRLYRATGNLRLVQRFAGHSSSTTTERYTYVFADELEDGIGKLTYRAA